MISVEPVASRQDFRDFIALPRRIYGGISGFAYPLDAESRDVLHPARGSFFTHGKVVYWLARRDGRPVGRIAAMLDDAARETQPGVGTFGCLDAVDDAGVVAALIATARDWLARRGCRVMRGPFALSINNESGLLIAGQDEPAMVLTPWHPPYLARRIQEAGLAPVKDLLTYRIEVAATLAPDPDAAAARARALAARVEAAGVTLRGLRIDRLDEEAQMICTLFNDAWRDNWGFVPMQVDEIAIVLRSLRPFLTPDNALVAQVDGRAVSFLFALQNLSELSRGLGGRMLPFNWLRLLWRVRTHRYRSARIVLMGSRADIRGSVLGSLIPLYLLRTLIERGRRYGLAYVEAGWILEDNRAVRTLIEQQGGVPCRRHRIFETQLEA